MFRITLLILFFLSTFAKAEVVKNFEVSGNERISKETIQVYGEIELEKDYSGEELNSILKKLYSTDFFENINLSLNNGTLFIKVEEYSIINDIILEGEKSDTIKKKLLEALQLKAKKSFISSKLNDDLNLLKKIYASLGYNFATVEAKVEKFSDKRINLLFTINRGEKTYITDIKFIGDKKLRDSRLRSIIVSEEYKFWKFLSRNTYFNEGNVELDKRLLANYYKSLGYYDVQVLSNNAQIKNNTTSLVYTLNAGTRYKINKISTNLDNVIDKKIFEPLRASFENLIGKYYSPFKVKKLLDEVDALIASSDLQFIEHSVNEIIEKDNIELKINIYEGKKELIEKIIISGNLITEEAVIRSELLLDEGDPLNEMKLQKSISNLKARNLFSEVKPSILEGTNKNQKIVEIVIEEKPTGEISAGAGIGTTGGSFAFKINENNWLGKGINISTGLDISSETLTGELSVTDPNFNFSGNSLTYYLLNTKNDKPDSGFSNNIFSIGIGTKFEQYREIYLSPKISFSYDDLKVESNASTTLKKQRGTFSDLTVDYGITSDKRDRAFGPTDGYILNFSQAFPLYADSPFVRNSVSLSKYKAFNPDFIGAFKFYVSAINGLNDENVRISKRLDLGSRLRGFEFGKIGPKDGNDYIGGNYAAASNLEINLPNLLPESTKTDVGIFLDFGNVWHVDYDNSINDSNKIRSTIGLNTNWQSPVGPMSFIFSQNLSKADTDITESFNFRLGTTF